MKTGKRDGERMLRIAMCACAPIILLACLGCEVTENDLLQQGQAYNAKGMYLNALDCYKQVLAMNPQNARAYEYRGVTDFEAGQYKSALADLNAALQIDPHFVDAYIDRGAVYTEMKEFDRARSDFDMALMLDPKSAQAYNDRATLSRNEGKLKEAVADYQRSIDLAPKKFETYCNLGLTYLDMQDYDNARKNFDQAKKRNRGSPLIVYYIGLTSARAKKHDEAEQEFTTAIKMKPNFAEALEARCLARFYLKKYDEAMSDAKQLESLGKKLNPDFMQQLQQARAGAEKPQNK